MIEKIKIRVLVDLIGCDATTTIDLDVSTDELEFLQRLSAMSKENSRYECMPTLEVYEGANKSE